MPDRIDETLTAIETESWLTATIEPNRQRGLQRRQYLAGEIRKKLPSFNRKQLNEALSLKVSFDNNPQSQKLRRGIRAIMLARFTIKNVPLANASALKRELTGKSETVLAKIFMNVFPSVTTVDPGQRQAWEPSNFTDPNNFPNWRGRWPGGQYRFIVTCLPNDDRAYPTLDDPERTLRSWDAISSSVIDETNSVIYGYYGFVLHVPASNVIVSDSQDQDLLNHLGTAMTRTAEKESLMSQVEKTGLLSQHLADLFAAQGELKTPLQCIRENRNERWNEIILLGRSLQGEWIRPSALFYRVSTDGQPYIAPKSRGNPVTDEIRERVEACSDWNDLPIIHIPDSSGRLG